MGERAFDRRRLLEGLSAGMAVGLAGCTLSTPFGDFEVDFDDEEDGQDGTTGDGDFTATETQPPTETTAESPAATDPSVSLDPVEDYFIGTDENVTGTTTGDVEEVVVVARDSEVWLVVSFDGTVTLAVDDDGSFASPWTVLSDGAGGGNDVLATAGSHEIGAIRAADVVGAIDASTRIAEADFEAGVSDVEPISVAGSESRRRSG